MNRCGGCIRRGRSVYEYLLLIAKAIAPIPAVCIGKLTRNGYSFGFGNCGGFFLLGHSQGKRITGNFTGCGLKARNTAVQNEFGIQYRIVYKIIVAILLSYDCFVVENNRKSVATELCRFGFVYAVCFKVGYDNLPGAVFFVVFKNNTVLPL